MHKLCISRIWASMTPGHFRCQNLLCLEPVVVPGLAFLGTFLAQESEAKYCGNLTCIGIQSQSVGTKSGKLLRKLLRKTSLDLRKLTRKLIISGKNRQLYIVQKSYIYIDIHTHRCVRSSFNNSRFNTRDLQI